MELVGRVHGGDLRGVQRNVASGGSHRVRILLGGDQRRLGPLDLAGHVADVVGAQLQPDALAPRATTANLLSSSCQPVSPTTRGQKYRKLPVRGGVKCQRLHRADTGAGVRRGAQCPHRARISPAARWVKVTANTCTRGHVSGGDELGDAVGDGAGLTGSRPGQHADRPARGQHRLALLVIEVGNQWVGDHRHGVYLGSGRRQTPGSATPRHNEDARYV